MTDKQKFTTETATSALEAITRKLDGIAAGLTAYTENSLQLAYDHKADEATKASYSNILAMTEAIKDLAAEACGILAETV